MVSDHTAGLCVPWPQTLLSPQENLAAEEGSHATAPEMNRGALCRAESYCEHLSGAGLCKGLLPGPQGFTASLKMFPSVPIPDQLNSDSVRRERALEPGQPGSWSPGCDLKLGT